MKNRILFMLLITSLFGWSQDNFRTEEIAVTNLLPGTLYVPLKTSEKRNLVIVIAGSGPTDRNGNQPQLNNNSLKMLCEGIANGGTTVFSFDKSIIAQMKTGTIDESKLLFDDMINDVKSIMNFFILQKKYAKIIIVGHSEGSLVGMVAAQENAAAFISLAGAGRPIDEVLEEQIVKQMPDIKTVLREKLNDLKVGKKIEPASINPALAGLFRASVQPYMISWIKLNPQTEIAKLKIPVLIVNGDKDIQVPAFDAELLHKASPQSKIEIIANMNHIFKTIDGGDSANQASYMNPTMPISAVLLTKINLFLYGLK